MTAPACSCLFRSHPRIDEIGGGVTSEPRLPSCIKVPDEKTSEGLLIRDRGDTTDPPVCHGHGKRSTGPRMDSGL